MEMIKLKWVKKDSQGEKETDKQALMSIMDGLRHSFLDDNEVSTLFVDVIPKMAELKINFVNCDVMEVPLVEYVDLEGKVHTARIRKRNTVIWTLLDKLCE